MDETNHFAANDRAGTAKAAHAAPPRWPAASLRAYLLTVIVLATVPLAGLTSWMIFQEGQASRRQFEMGLQRAAASFALTIEREVAASVDVLTILSYSQRVRDNDIPGFFQALVELPRQLPAWSAAYLIDLDGRVLFSTARPTAGSPAVGPHGSALATTLVDDPAGGAAFRRVKSTLKPAVSDLIVDPVKGATIGVQVPVMVDGMLRYVLAATVDTANWKALLASASLPPDTRILLIDGNGRLVASTGAGPAVVEQISTAARLELTAPASHVQRATVLNAEPSYTAWSPVGGTGWAVGMDVPAAGLDDAASTALRTAISAGVLSLLAGLGLSLLLARTLTRPLRQLAWGGPRAVIDPIEIREIVVLRDALRSAEAEREEASRRISAEMAERDTLAVREQAARRESETANRVKDEFMAMLSHELRNPLGAISSAAELLNRIGSKEAGAQTAVAIIARQTRHLSRLMEDLLDVARVIAGKIMLSRSPLDLGMVTQRLMSTLEMTGATGNHRITVDTDEAWVSADITRIEQIINNLVTNALKYTPAGGSVSISVRATGAGAVLIVADNGVGIAPALLPRLFDLFVQGDRALDRRQGGLGVGLTLVRRLVEQHDGTVDVECPAVGTVFTVRLPLIDAAPRDTVVAEQHRSRPPTAVASKRVVVIEDNEDALEVMRALLEFSGHEVLSAADGTAGLQLLIDSGCDVALVDIGLPGLDGLEVCQRARAAGVKSRLVALTGYGQARDVELTREAGFDDHLVKPIDPHILQALLEDS